MFFDSESAALSEEREYLAEIAGDPRCQNISEGGYGRTSEDMRRTLARPEIKERHIAGVHARWAKQEEVDRASAAALKAFSDPHVLAKYPVAGASIAVIEIERAVLADVVIPCLHMLGAIQKVVAAVIARRWQDFPQNRACFVVVFVTGLHHGLLKDVMAD